MPVEPFLDFVDGGCRQIEAPAAVPGLVTVNADVNLIDGGMGPGSIIASGTAEAVRIPAVWDETPGENEFTETRDECSCPGGVTVNLSSDTVGENPPTQPGAVCLAGAAMTVTAPAATDGRLEIWALDTQFLALVATIKIGSFSFQSDVSFSGPVTPSTLAETVRTDLFTVTTAPGSDPAGTIEVEIIVS